MLLGAMLGYMFYWSGSLWVPVIAHAFINGMQVVLAYLHEHGAITFDIAGDEASSRLCGVNLYCFGRCFTFLLQKSK